MKSIDFDLNTNLNEAVRKDKENDNTCAKVGRP